MSGQTAENGHQDRDWLYAAPDAATEKLQHQAGRRHTATVRSVKILLLLAVVALCGLLVYNFTEDRHSTVNLARQHDAENSTATVAKKAGPAHSQTDVLPEGVMPAAAAQSKIAMIGARYGGLDNKRQPYTITAAEASRSPDSPDVVHLSDPMADLTLTDGGWIAVQSRRGVYMQEEQELFLEDHVRFFHDIGYELLTEGLHMDLKTHEVRADKKVAGHGPAGAIEAQGMDFVPADDKVVFTGPAKMTLFLQTKNLFLKEAP
ncbi:MAG: LPS export ABC transporter periplasmic protein LptC [Alphaproteobacteria bacterium]|nr:MAG: LPS export ABC transporter periplasmic protein LptC [Alphaproteobacteria bacterium]